jgi:hypothetical protein
MVDPSENRFCDKCGHDLTELKATPNIDYAQAQYYTPILRAGKILGTRGSIEWERKLVTVRGISMTTSSNLGTAPRTFRDCAFVSEPTSRKVRL